MSANNLLNYLQFFQTAWIDNIINGTPTLRLRNLLRFFIFSCLGNSIGTVLVSSMD